MGPDRGARILRYGVALLSTVLALIPAIVLPDVLESRLVVFAVAVMVSAWYGGWKPGLLATAFAIAADAYFALHGMRTEADYGRTALHLAVFTVVALVICALNAALRSAQEDLRRSESNFRSLVTDSPYGFLRCDAKGRILDVNPAFAQMLGSVSGDELVNRSLADLHRNPQEWSTLEGYFSARRGFTGLLAELSRKDGGVVVVRLFGRAIRNQDDPTTNFELFAEDVTERRSLEQQVRQSQNMEAVGRFAGGIAHDFNNLLMVISGYSEFLLEKLDPTSAFRGPAQEIADATERATALTRQLLTFSRRPMLNPRVLELNAVVNESSKMLTRLIGEDIDLVIVPGTERGMVKADPGQLAQVIMNLALNARGAMPKGGRLCIETGNAQVGEGFAQAHTGTVAGDYVKLTVSDTGAAMDPDAQAHIFEPFFAAQGKKGSGFGLSTVYAIVKQSGGHITVHSQAGEGTRFEIYLPRVAESGESAHSARPLPAGSPMLKEKAGEVADSSPAQAGKVQGRIPAFRAQRFELRVPLRYRLPGQTAWHDGTTENISRSGMFFRAAEKLQAAEQLEISLILPPEISGLSAVEVVCRGEIVRSTEAEGAAMAPGVAAKILHYQFPTMTAEPRSLARASG